MEFTGERMVPESADSGTFWEHIYRYRFALPQVKGKRVLDIACGEGYGTAALLAAGAATVLGIDVSPEACAHAAERYRIPVSLGDAQNIPLENASVDTVVSFETIEHLAEPARFLDECARVLVPGGQIVISTPNRAVYQENVNNPFHLNELDEPEFVRLLQERFGDIRLFTQRPQSAPWWSLTGLASDRSFWQTTRGFRRARRTLQNHFCPEVTRPSLLLQARNEPVKAILSPAPGISHFANPFAIHPRKVGDGAKYSYFVAVATR